MKPLISLNRKLKTSRWTFVGDVAFSEKRTYELSILQLSAEWRYIDGSTINEHLLGGSRLPAAERLMSIMQRYRLLDEQGGLTEDGKTAIEHGEIFVPQRGAWEVLLAENEPLLGDPVLGLAPAKEPTAFDDMNPSNRTKAPARLVALPQSLIRLQGHSVLPALDGDKQIRIDSFGEEHVGRPESARDDLAISLQFDASGEARVQIGDESVSAPTAPDRETVWGDLLRGAGLDEYWNEPRQALAVRFDEMTDAERRDQSRSIQFESPMIGQFGTFDSLVVNGVPLVPLGDADAQKWAEWRLRNSIGEIATTARFDTWWDEAGKPFDEFALRQPERAVLAALARPNNSIKPNADYWRLQAAIDFTL